VPGGEESAGAGAAARGEARAMKASLTMILETAWGIKVTLERYGSR
jgi:hypothetical protein